MVLQIPVESPFPHQVVKEIVEGALRNEAELARFRHDQFARECEAFEAKFLKRHSHNQQRTHRRGRRGRRGNNQENLPPTGQALRSSAPPQRGKLCGEKILQKHLRATRRSHRVRL
jgi:hypothetical protein